VSVEAAIAQRLGSDIGVVPLAVAYAGGVLAGFGPCVLPMMPVVFGYVTGRVAGTAEERASTGQHASYLRGLGLASVFVFGMSMVFAVLGVGAGLLGRALLFGAWATYVVAGICVLLGLHMLGVIELPFATLTRLQPRATKRVGILGALLLGIAFGVVATPCSTPVLAAIATMAAARRSAIVGGVLLFAFGLGKGLPLMLVGLASGSLGAMRQLSRITSSLMRAGGVALLVTAVYLVWTA